MSCGGTAPDGSPVDLYAQLGPLGEPELVDAVVPAGAAILELGAGAGRLTHRLLELGHEVVAVDESPAMLAEIEGAETVLADCATLSLGRRFPVVLLASNLVNVVDDEKRRAFLRTCSRHVRPGGHVIVQRLPREWSPREGWYELGPARARVAWFERTGSVVSAELEYLLAKRRYRHAFRARLLTDAELDRELAASGLRRRSVLDEHGIWIDATSA